MRRSIAATVVVMTLLAGCGRSEGTDDAAPAPAGSEIAGLGGSREPSASALAGPTVIPASAMLQAADIAGGAQPASVQPDVAPALRPPRPCGTVGASDRLRRSAAAVSVVHPTGDGTTLPTVVLELVMLFDQDGAVRYLAELTSDVAKCTGPDRNGRRYKPAGTGPLAESIMITVTEPVELPDGQKGSRELPVLVARVGPTVIVLADIGWEFGGGHPALVKELAPKAGNRVRTAFP